MASATSVLRMSGMNSGLDTEGIVNALTATTKNKINTNERKVLKLQAQQDAYRSLIDSFNKFKSKYCDLLSGSTSLKSTSLFSSFKSTLSNASGTNVVGVKVSNSVNSNTGTYNVKVHKVATQSTVKSAASTGKPADLSRCEEGNTYTMSVSVGGKSKNITFEAGADEAATRDNINAALKDAYGVTNSGANLVSMGDDGKFVSTDKSSVVSTSPTIYTNSRSLGNILGLQTGNNTLSVTVGDTTKTVSFSTIAEHYFDDIFDDDGNIKEDADKTKVALYKDIAANQRNGEIYNSFTEWEENLTDDEKEAFVLAAAQESYNEAINDATEKLRADAKDSMVKDALKDIEQHITFLGDGKDKDGYQATPSSMTAEQQELFNKIVDDWNAKNTDENGDRLSAGDEGYVYFKDYFEKEYTNAIESEVTENDIDDYIADDENGQKLFENYQKTLDKIEDTAKANTQKVIDKEQKAAYKANFDIAKQEAYDAAVAAGEISDVEEDENYISLEKFKFTDAQFKESAQYETYEQEAQDIADRYDGVKTYDYDSLSTSQKVAFYEKQEYTGADFDEYLANYSAEQAVKDLNTANLKNNLGALSIEGVDINVDIDDDGNITVSGESKYLTDDDGEYLPRSFAITQNTETNSAAFGLDPTDFSGTASQIDTTSKLNELGLEPDANGKYNFSINGVKFSFDGDETITDMMRKVNASEAGVKMSYTTLTNQFSITANEYGRGVEIDFEDGEQGLLAALGFDGNETFTEGVNTSLTINGIDVETTSNSYTVDGTTFTFSEAAEGTEFTNEVTRDYSKPISAIKSFVEDYNKLIEEVYGYVDDEPNKDYYFLTDDDLEEMDLSESQQTKWENLAKKGILYRDSALSSIMSKLRTVIYNSVDAADGTKVGLYTLGITTSSDWTSHGKLVFDDKISDEKFEEIFAQYADEFCELFTDTEKGIAYQFESIIKSATNTTGKESERGVLVQKAGVSGTASATSNSLYRQIESLKNTISTLKDRYEKQQDRYWSMYSNMETMLGGLNSQSSYITQMMGM